MPPKVNKKNKVKLSEGECLKIHNNINDLVDNYQPLINEVIFMINTLYKVRSQIENLENFAELFGTNQMKDSAKRLLKILNGFSIVLEKMVQDLYYTQEKTLALLHLFKEYEKFCKK
jgi:hypothetical protein